MTDQTKNPEIHPALADVAMIDGPSAAAACGISITSWQTLVSRGEAPQPVFRAHRCTRWLLSDVRQFLIQRAQQTAREPAQGDALLRRAKMASLAAAAKRAEGGTQ
ncbi:hypothetical protein CDN99_11705 [Roseateles aquatilis]|uniref:Uncharacterized protein n=1 Tax=Roseateles aquatilis TaxID=431061 RepID=A0A246JEX7_9BURK|nr:hypothetical protein [Roseateles aquatilis]OWQ90826.1 hypothetical protein CDN99_11705 [Roseateles aquatilis]